MDTTGSSSSAAIPEAAPPPAALDLVVGMPAGGDGRERPAVDAARAALGSGNGAPRWRVLSARPAPADAGPAAAGAPASGEATEVHYVRHPSDALNVPFHGMTARARALQAIFREALAGQAGACVIVDPRAAVTPEWIEALARPLRAAAVDFVAPAYHRHPYSGALVRGVVHPLFRALYGVHLRTPAGTDFACSRPFIEAVIGDPVWESDAGRIGIDLWLSATAASGGFRIGEAQLGPPGEDRTKLDLSTTISQVLGFCFAEMERRAATWHRVSGSRAVPLFGTPLPPPPKPEVNAPALVESFQLGLRALQDVCAEVLPPLALLQWRRLAHAPVDQFRVDDGLWARTIYDFAMAHRLRLIAREHPLGALAPLYLGWLASFVLQTGFLPPEETEARIERLCAVFEAEKPYLISQWRWPERFRPVRVRR